MNMTHQNHADKRVDELKDFLNNKISEKIKYEYYYCDIADSSALEKALEREHKRMLNCSDGPKGLSSKSVEVLKKYREDLKDG